MEGLEVTKSNPDCFQQARTARALFLSQEIIFQDDMQRCRHGMNGIICGKAEGVARRICALGRSLAEDVAEGLLQENPEGLQSLPRGRLSTQGTARGHRFTWLPPMAFPQIVILSNSARVDWVLRHSTTSVYGHLEVSCCAYSQWEASATAGSQ